MATEQQHSLDNIALFSSLPKPARDDLSRQCRFRKFGGGEHIIDSQSESRDIYFVISGVVRVVNYSASGREIALDDIPAGGFFGELAALDGAPRSAFVLAQCDVAVTAAMPHEVFLNVVEKNPAIALEIMKRLARMIRHATERIMDLSTLGANNRIHADLLRQAKIATTDDLTALLTPIPSHSDIAGRVSTTRETVARVLNELARNGVVERKKDVLVINDIERLTHLVEDVRGNF